MTSAPESADDQRSVRIAKLDVLREAGILPFAERYERTHVLSEAYAAAAASDPEAGTPTEGPLIRIAGRVLTIRRFGKLFFLHLQDGSGKCQVALDTRVVGAEAMDLFRKAVDIGDHIGVSGRPGLTKKGEPTVFGDAWTFLSKALRPLPEKWSGLKDVEARQRARYLDLLTNPQTRERFRFRTRFLKALRAYLDASGFEEVDTPVLQTKPSGALARPFFTHHNALDMACVLRIAPETWLKQCVAGGMDRVYEVARCFRNEGMDPSHLQDFTMVEWYAAYWNYQDNMQFTQELIVHLLDVLLRTHKVAYQGREIDFTPPWPRVSFRELIQKDAGFDYEDYPDAASLLATIRERGIDLERDGLEQLGRGTLIDLLYKKVSRPQLIDPVFLTGHPIDLSPLARKNDGNPVITDRYQLVVNGWEVVNAYSELVDPLDQRERFEGQAAARAAGDDEALTVDEDYLLAMEHGMPPMSGWGMGVERFLALLTDQDNLRDVVLFPLMKPRGGAAVTAPAPGEVSAPATGAARAAPTSGGDAASPGAEREIMSAEHRALLGTPADDVEHLGLDVEAAEALFDKHVTTPSLRRQMRMARVVMGALARQRGANEAAWRILGLLHNVDFDTVKEADQHCLVAAAWLREAGMHPSGIHAIAAHNDKGLHETGIRCISAMDHAVSCAEAVVGLAHAAAQVLPSKSIGDLKLKSLRKRFRNAKFAANVERDLIERCEGLGLDLDTFFQLVIDALRDEPVPG